MADKDLQQGQQLLSIDKTRYTEIAPGIYAETIVILGCSVAVTGAVEIVGQYTLAALESRLVCRWINDKVPGTDPVVLTDAAAGDQPGIYYNLLPGDIVLASQICMELTTISDSVEFELGYTDQINGGGTFRPITPQRAYATGNIIQGFDGITFELTPPLSVTYASGARSITFRVDCNDADATITPAWHGLIVNEE